MGSKDSITGMKRLLEQKRRQVGCLILFFAIIFALMADRGVFFGILNEVGFLLRSVDFYSSYV